MMTAVYIATFLGIVVAIAGGATMFWRRWVDRMPTPADWMEAFRIIWVDVYGMPWERRPRVIWVPGQLYAHNGHAVTGIADQGAITVGFSPDARVSQTAFAHELCHASRRLKGIDPDGGHITADWTPDGIVATANAALRSRGW